MICDTIAKKFNKCSMFCADLKRKSVVEIPMAIGTKINSIQAADSVCFREN